MTKSFSRFLRIGGLSATACVLVWFLVLPLGARAGLDLNVEFVHGSGSGDRSLTPPSGTEVTGNWNVVVRATSISSLRNLRVAIQPDLSANIIPALGPGAVKSESVPLGTQTKELAMLWETSTLTPYNGVYLLVATADSLVESESATVTSLKVNNPPRAPQELSVRLDHATPLVTWAPNPEPDIVGYSVFRFEAGSLAHQQSVTSPIFRDEQAPAGVPLRYEVEALRKSPVDPKGIASPRSARTPTVALPLDEEDAPVTAASLPAQAAVTPTPVGVEVEDKVGPARAVGFETLLPYEESPVPVLEDVPPPVEFEEMVAAPPLMPQPERSPYVDPLKNIAGAAILLVIAMHLARLSRVVSRAHS